MKKKKMRRKKFIDIRKTKLSQFFFNNFFYEIKNISKFLNYFKYLFINHCLDSGIAVLKK